MCCKFPHLKTAVSFRKSRFSVAVTLALASMAPVHAQTAIYEWRGSVNNDVNNPANWVQTQAGSSPYDSGQAIINTNNAAPAGQTPEWVLSYASSRGIIVGYDEHGSGVYANQLYIGQGPGNQGQLLVKNSNEPESSSIVAYLRRLHVGAEGGSGELTITAREPNQYGQKQSVIFVNEQTDIFTLGAGTGGNGTINVLGTGKSTAEQTSSAYAALNIVRYGTDPSLPASHIAIGADGGAGVLNVNGGDANFQGDSLLIGRGTGSAGQINVLAGGKFTNNVTGPMPPGNDGAVFVLGENGGVGTLNISGRSTVKDVYSRAVIGTGMTIGRGSGGVGKISITQGAQLQSAVSEYWDSNSQNTTRHEIGVNDGTGSVTIDGQGSIWKVLGKIYAFYGDTSEVGKLYLGYSGTGELTLSNGGTLSIGKSEYGYNYDDLTGRGYFAEVEHTGGLGSLYLGQEADGTGTLSIGGSFGAAARGTGVLDVSDIQFGEGKGTLHFNHTDLSGTYEFNTLLKSGSGQSNILHSNGVTLFNEKQTDFTGQTTITGGYLIVNAPLGGNVEVKDQGTLGGRYTPLEEGDAPLEEKVTLLGDVKVSNGGTVSPGAYQEDRINPPSSATLTASSFTFDAGSRLSIQGNPTGEIDLLHAVNGNGGSGTVTLNTGSRLYIQAGAGAWAEETKYVFIQADGGLTGQFSTVGSNMAFLTSEIEYDENTAYIYITRNDVDFGDIGGTYNQTQTGLGVESLGSGHAVYDTIVSMDRDQALKSFDNLSGEIHANVKGAVLTNTRHSRQAVNAHLNSGVLLDEISPHRNLWVNAWGHTGTIDNDGNSSKLDVNGYGFLLGWDAYRNGKTIAGLAAGYERQQIKSDHLRNSKANTDMFHLMAYGATRVGVIDLKGGIGYSWLAVDTERDIHVTNLQTQHKADYNGNLLQAFIEGSHTFEVTEKVDVTPYLGVAYQRVKTSNATESGASATALHHHGSSDDLISTSLGVRGQWRIDDQALLYGDIGWQNNFSPDEPKSTLNFNGGNPYNVKGSHLNSHSAVLGLGAQFEIKPNNMFRIGYEGEYGNNVRSHGAKLLWELRF